MTKAEMIERYGIERYEAHKAKMKERTNERYHNDSEFRETHKAKMREHSREYTSERYHNDSEFRETHKAKMREHNRTRYHNDLEYRLRHARSYCRPSEFELIENYELAKVDNFRGWHIHHRLEIHDDYSNSKEDLIMMNLYYNRPANELIFLTNSEHMKLHHKARIGNE